MLLALRQLFFDLECDGRATGIPRGHPARSRRSGDTALDRFNTLTRLTIQSAVALRLPGRSKLSSGKPGFALLQKRAHAFAAVFRFEAAQLGVNFVLQHLLERILLAGVNRMFGGGD